MIGYKGFDQNWGCRDKQYEVGKTYEEEKAVLCQEGMHFCENPFDVFTYYSPGDRARYAEVEADDVSPEKDIDSKRVCKKLTIKAELNIIGIVKAGMAYIKEHIDVEKIKEKVLLDSSTAATSGNRSTAATSGYSSTAATSGNESTAATSGNESTAATSGYKSTAATSGYKSTAATSGYESTAATSGNESTAATSGYESTAATSGYKSTAATSGNRSTAATSGYSSTAMVEGDDSIAISVGIEGRAKGALGCWLVLSEWEKVVGYKRKSVKCFYVDGKNIKADTLYMLKNGEPVEISDDEM